MAPGKKAVSYMTPEGHQQFVVCCSCPPEMVVEEEMSGDDMCLMVYRVDM